MLDYFLYKTGQFVAVHLPLRFCYRIAMIFSDMRCIFAIRDRRETCDNIKAIFPGKSDEEVKRIRLRMFRNFAKYLVDFFRLAKIDMAYIKRNIKIENIHYFDEALAKGKGAIVLTAHLGNWELGGVVIALLGYPFWVVALPHKNKRVDNFFNFQRESKRIKVIPLGRAGRFCLNALKNNRLLALLGDRDFHRGGVVIDFLGRPAYLPKGPATFSLKTGAPIVPGFMYRNEDDTLTLRIEKPIEPSYIGDRENGQMALMRQYKVIIEEYIRRYPDQWYMFRRFWVE